MHLPRIRALDSPGGSTMRGVSGTEELRFTRGEQVDHLAAAPINERRPLHASAHCFLGHDSVKLGGGIKC